MMPKTSRHAAPLVIFVFLVLGCASGRLGAEAEGVPASADAGYSPTADSATGADPAKAKTASPASQPQGKSATEGKSTSEKAGPAASAPTASAEGAEAPNIYDRCGNNPHSSVWLDRVNYGVYRSVCASATWLDSFFGGSRGDGERDTSFGRVGVGGSWDDFNGTSLKFRFKAKVQLPRTKNRLNAFVGRFEKDEFVRGQNEDVGSVPAIFQETQEKDWLIGLGYNPVRSARSRLDFDAGVRADFPVDPFLKGTYRYYLFMNDTNLLRVAQTVFWTNQLEFGTTSRIDAERVLASNLHLRWQALGTVAQETEGLDWRSSVTLYQHLGGLRAIAWEAEVKGETGAPVSLDHYGLRAIYRQQIFRDDLFLELQGRVFWPKSIDHPEREATPGVGFGFEMLWGDQPPGGNHPRKKKAKG